MNGKEHPCARGLTWNCFNEDPEFAKRAFALRLFYTLLPPQVSQLLARMLRKPLFDAGLTPPAGIDLPPGAITTPGTIIPPGWTPPDPLPPGVIIPPGTVFPPGWTPADPLPPGIVIPPGVVIPPDWTPGDPLPPGVLPPPVIPPGVPDTGGISPLYVAPGEPGPINQPGRNPPPPVTYWFNEQFNNLTDNSWTDDSVPTGEVSIVAGECRFYGNDAAAIARIYRTHPSAFSTNWTLKLRAKVEYATAWVANYFYTGTYLVEFWIIGTTGVRIRSGASICNATLSDFADAWHEWKLVVTGALASLYQDDTIVITDCALNTNTSNPGRMNLDSRGISLRYYDYMKFT